LVEANPDAVEAAAEAPVVGMALRSGKCFLDPSRAVGLAVVMCIQTVTMCIQTVTGGPGAVDTVFAELATVWSPVGKEC
jgi:hypothetical protein